MTNREQELLRALEALTDLALEWAEQIDSEWGDGRSIDELREEGALDRTILAAEAAIARAKGG